MYSTRCTGRAPRTCVLLIYTVYAAYGKPGCLHAAQHARAKSSLGAYISIYEVSQGTQFQVLPDVTGLVLSRSLNLRFGFEQQQ